MAAFLSSGAFRAPRLESPGMALTGLLAREPDDPGRAVVYSKPLTFPTPAPEKIRSEKPQRANDQAGHVNRYSYDSILELGRLIGHFGG